MNIPLLVSAAVCLDSQKRVLLTQRPPKKEWAGFWEFPGGKVEPNESPEIALSRELKEELAIEVTQATPYFFIYNTAGKRDVLLLFYRADFIGTPSAMEGNTIGWFAIAELATVNIIPADAPLIKKLLTDCKQPR